MSQFNPLVSIVIPVYNGANFLREAIDSALAQTYQNIEVVVVNDGSNDDGSTEKVALSYGDKIRYFSKTNGGVASALNLGIVKMAGEYFSWLSHDDSYMPNKIKENIEALMGLDNKQTIIFSDWKGINGKGRTIFEIRYSDKHESTLLNTSPYPVARGCLNGCTLLIHRDVFTNVGVFNENLPTTQDFDLWIRILAKYPINYIEKILVCYRDHGKQTSKKDLQHEAAENEIWIKMMKELSKGAFRSIAPSVRAFFFDEYLHLKQSSLGKAVKFAKDRVRKEKPVVSVVLPTFNRMYCVRRAIDSVLNQSFQDFELLVVDDGSTDNTVSVVPDDPRINYIKKENGGVSSARNRGIAEARGKYIAFLDSDDEWGADHLQNHVACMESHPEAGLTYNYVMVLDHNGHLCRKASVEITTPAVESILYTNKNSLMTPAIMVRRTVIDNVLPFDEAMDMCEDLDLWRRIAISHKLVAVPYYSTTVHLRKGQLNPSLFMRERYKYLRKALLDNDYSISDQTQIDLLLDIYTAYLPLGILDEDTEAFLHNISCDFPEYHKKCLEMVFEYKQNYLDSANREVVKARIKRMVKRVAPRPVINFVVKLRAALGTKTDSTMKCP